MHSPVLAGDVHCFKVPSGAVTTKLRHLHWAGRVCWSIVHPPPPSSTFIKGWSIGPCLPTSYCDAAAARTIRLMFHQVIGNSFFSTWPLGPHLVTLDVRWKKDCWCTTRRLLICAKPTLGATRKKSNINQRPSSVWPMAFPELLLLLPGWWVDRSMSQLKHPHPPPRWMVDSMTES